jgi:arginase
MDITLVLVPSHAGDDGAASARGPGRLLDAGAEDVLSSPGTDVYVETVDRGDPFHDTASSSAVVNRKLAAMVRRAIREDRLPVVLAGSCNAALGVLAGFAHSDCGAVWLDAHADFNTPESSVSGFFPGMSLAIATGHCYREYWGGIGDATPLAEDAVALFGVRDLSPDAERERLDQSAITPVAWRDCRPEKSIEGVLDVLRSRVEDVYLHIDLDAFAPDVAPGTADEPVPGGLSVADAEAIIEGIGGRFAIRAVTLATFAPERDEEDKTLRVALRLLELVGELAART